MFYDRLRKECEKQGIKITNLLKELEISTSSGTAWKNGALPKGETLLKIKEKLNVSVDYLISGEEPERMLIKEEQELLTLYRSLTEKEKGKAEILLEQLAEESAERKEKKSS